VQPLNSNVKGIVVYHSKKKEEINTTPYMFNKKNNVFPNE